MLRLLYGTRNAGKLDYMRRLLHDKGIQVIGLSEIQGEIPDADENGDTPLENARIKAITYRDLTGMATLGLDSALYIDGIADAEQPSIHVRRVHGKTLTDEEMIAYYSEVVRGLGGRATARYRNGLCIAFPDGRIAERFDDTVASEPFYLVEKPHPRRIQGFPLDSLSVDIKTGKYSLDIEETRSDSDRDHSYNNGYARFVCEAMGL